MWGPLNIMLCDKIRALIHNTVLFIQITNAWIQNSKAHFEKHIYTKEYNVKDI